MSIGSMVSDLFGSTNRYQAEQAKTDPNAYQYGGAPGGADEAANRYRQQSEAAQNRQAVQANYTQADQDRAMQQQARQGQATLAGAMQARAMGQTPSIAQMQGDRSMQQVQAAQASQAASARGPAAMALAQQNAANQTANAQGQIAGQTQINAANERMQAEQGAMGAYGSLRGQDLASQGQSAQQGQYNAGLSAQQRQMNDQMTQGMASNEMGVRNSQLTAGMNQQAQNSANFNAAQNINSGVAGQNASTNQANGAGVVSAVGSVAGMAAMSDERAKTDVTPLVTSTWGVGRGVSPEEVGAQNRALNDRWTHIGVSDRAVQGMNGTSGGFAVPGLSPGLGDPNDKSKYMSLAQPLQQADRETVGLANAKQAEGAPMSEEQQRQAGGAQFRMANDKKGAGAAAAQNPTTAQKFGGAASDAGAAFSKAAGAVDTSLHVPNSYSAPQLIPLQSGIEMKTGLKPLSNYMSSDEREKDVVPLADDPTRGRLQMNDEHAFYARNDDNDGRPSLSGPSAPSHLKSRSTPSLSAAMASKPVQKRRERTPEELSAEADRLMSSMRSEHESRMSSGPAVGGSYLTSDSRAKQQAYEAGAQDAAKHFTGDEYTWGPDGPVAVASPMTEVAPDVHPLPPPPAPPMSAASPPPATPDPRAAEDAAQRARIGARAAGFLQGQAALYRNQGDTEAAKEGFDAVRARDAARTAMGPDYKTPNSPAKEPKRGLVLNEATLAPPAPEEEPRHRNTVGVRPAPARRRETTTSDERAKNVDKGPLANAARSMAGSEYEYKGPFTPPDQEQGEKNVGPMANNMAKDPVAGTIVKRDPSINLPGGGLVLDQGKMVKTLGAIVADLQKQQDEDRNTIATLSSRMRRKP